jgi:hypothetical protein
MLDLPVDRPEACIGLQPLPIARRVDVRPLLVEREVAVHGDGVRADTPGQRDIDGSSCGVLLEPVARVGDELLKAGRVIDNSAVEAHRHHLDRGRARM